MDSVIEAIAGLLESMKTTFIPRRIDRCPESNSDKTVFLESRGRKRKNESRRIFSVACLDPIADRHRCHFLAGRLLQDCIPRTHELYHHITANRYAAVRAGSIRELPVEAV
jgi:hypothetical protein